MGRDPVIHSKWSFPFLKTIQRSNSKSETSDDELSETFKTQVMVDLNTSVLPATTRASSDESDEDDSFVTAQQRADSMVSSSSSYSFSTLLGDAEEEPVIDTGKHVHFGLAEIKEYSQVLGDHPYCSMGCPLELGWKATAAHRWTVEEYENEHRANYCTSMMALKLTPEERRAILDGQVSDQEIRKACRRRNRNRNEACMGQRKMQREFFGCPASRPSCQ